MANIALAQNERTGSNLGYSDEWCAYFVSDCARIAGQTSAIPAHGNVLYLYNNIMNAGGKSIYDARNGTGSLSDAKIGDIAILDTTTGGNTSRDHVEIVYKVSGSSVYTVGGNSGSGSSYSTRKVTKHSPYSSSRIVYIVRPNYTGAIEPPKDVYANLGDDFYAYIGHGDLYKWVENSNYNVQCGNATANNNQIWHFLRHKDGSYSILSYENGYAMDVADASYSAGANVQMMPYTGNSAQKFYIYEINGYYLFKSSYTDLWFDLNYDNYNVKLEEKSGAAPQNFNIQICDYEGYLPQDLGNDFYAYIGHGDLYKWVENTNYNVQCGNATANDNQIWHFLRHADRSYSILSYENGYAMDVADASYSAGANVQMMPYVGNSAQKFYIYEINGYYLFKSSYTDLWFDLNYDNYNVKLEEKSGAAPQNFNIQICEKFNVNYYSLDNLIEEYSQIKFENNSINLKQDIPIRKNYVFREWNTVADGSGVSYNPGDIYSDNTDLTLYAIWEHDTFSLGNDTLNIDKTNALISGRDLFGISQAQLEAQFGNGNLKVTMKDKNRVTTGTMLELVDVDNLVYDTLTVVIFGDVNGDGWYDGNDAFLVNLIVNGMLDKDDVGEAVWTAADCNHDGIIDKKDVDLLTGAGLLLNNVDQSATQAELEANTFYIEYMGLIDQSVDVDINDNTNIDDNVGQGLAPAETGNTDFEAIFMNIIAFIQKIYSYLFSILF